MIGYPSLLLPDDTVFEKTGGKMGLGDLENEFRRVRVLAVVFDDLEESSAGAEIRRSSRGMG